MHIYCIVRELPDANAYERVLSNFRKYGLFPDDQKKFTEDQENLWKLFQKRVTAVRGEAKIIIEVIKHTPKRSTIIILQIEKRD